MMVNGFAELRLATTGFSALDVTCPDPMIWVDGGGLFMSLGDTVAASSGPAATGCPTLAGCEATGTTTVTDWTGLYTVALTELSGVTAAETGVATVFSTAATGAATPGVITEGAIESVDIGATFAVPTAAVLLAEVAGVAGAIAADAGVAAEVAGVAAELAGVAGGVAGVLAFAGTSVVGCHPGME